MGGRCRLAKCIDSLTTIIATSNSQYIEAMETTVITDVTTTLCPNIVEKVDAVQKSMCCT